MHVLLIIVLLGGLFFGPQLWAKHVFKRYAKPLDRIPGSGGELARHLLDTMEMTHIKVETTTEGGDHYDPESKTVRLGKSNYENHSLTAIAVASHEVGHAIQHQLKDKRLMLRSRLIMIANKAQKIGAISMLFIPVIVLLTRLPHTGLLMFLIGFMSLGSAAVVHLITLPVELDASFNKALPILNDYLPASDIPAVRKILQAAALTYVAASLASLLNMGRWIALLRR